MRTPQKKFFDLLLEAAAAVDLEGVVAYHFSNTGTIYLQAADSFETKLQVPFSFDGGKLALGWLSGGRTVGTRQFDGSSTVALFPSRPNPVFAQFNVDAYGEAISSLIVAASL